MAEQLHLEITTRGAGPAVILTHGWIDTSQAWAGAAEALSDSYTTHAWDMRAHGKSDAATPGEYTRDHSLADMARVIDGAEAPVVLAGHSLGGYLSLAYTLNNPEQVRALVLVAAGPGFRKEEAREQWNENVDGSAKKFEVPEGSEMLSKHVDSWVIDNLEQITVPTLVIIGEHDKRFAASAAVFEKYLDVRGTVVVPDAGHSVHKKHPEPVAAAMREFLDSL